MTRRRRRIVAERVQYNSFPKILSAPDIYTTDAFVTAAVAGALENTSRVISVAITTVTPYSDWVGGGSTYNSSVFLQSESCVFPTMTTTRPALYTIYIRTYTLVYNGWTSRDVLLRSAWHFYFSISVFPSLSPFFLFVYMIFLLYIRYFSHCHQNLTASIQNYTSLSLSLYLSFYSLSHPSLYLSISLFPILIFSLTHRPFYWSRLKVCYCSLHAIPALEISAITILVYKTLVQIEPIQCRRHGRRQSNNRKSDRAKKTIKNMRQ